MYNTLKYVWKCYSCYSCWITVDLIIVGLFYLFSLLLVFMLLIALWMRLFDGMELSSLLTYLLTNGIVYMCVKRHFFERWSSCGNLEYYVRSRRADYKDTEKRWNIEFNQRQGGKWRNPMSIHSHYYYYYYYLADVMISIHDWLCLSLLLLCVPAHPHLSIIFLKRGRGFRCFQAITLFDSHSKQPVMGNEQP